MWFIFGLGAIISALANIILTFQRSKKAKFFSYLSMALTALTVTASYYQAAERVVTEDWSYLMDVLPTMSKALIILVLGSILINSLSLFFERDI